MISIIIPVLNEEKNIVDLLKSLSCIKGPKEIIVVDGGSRDNTVELSREYAKVIRSKKGRANQMNQGAKCAKGDILWFVHSDSIIDENSLEIIEETIRKGSIAGGFSLYFHDSNNVFLKYIALTSNLRADYTKLFFGDQGIFMKKDIFHEIGGYPKIAIMEDFQFSLELKKKKGKVMRVKGRIGTSSRRFREGGIFRTFLFMQKMKILYIFGVSPEKLNKIYREAR